MPGAFDLLLAGVEHDRRPPHLDGWWLHLGVPQSNRDYWRRRVKEQREGRQTYGIGGLDEPRPGNNLVSIELWEADETGAGWHMTRAWDGELLRAREATPCEVASLTRPCRGACDTRGARGEA